MECNTCFTLLLKFKSRKYMILDLLFSSFDHSSEHRVANFQSKLKYVQLMNQDFYKRFKLVLTNDEKENAPKVLHLQLFQLVEFLHLGIISCRCAASLLNFSTIILIYFCCPLFLWCIVSTDSAGFFIFTLHMFSDA